MKQRVPGLVLGLASGLALGLVVGACGGTTATPTTATATPAGGGEAVAVLPDVPFAQLDHAQRVDFMKQQVVPAMKPIFQQHDATRYAEFGCATCHGVQADAGHYDMPNADLTKIGRSQAFYAKFKPADLQWMGGQVLPKMAELLGRQASFTEPDPRDAFGCAGCHTFDPSELAPAPAP